MGPPRLPRATRPQKAAVRSAGERLPGQLAHGAEPAHVGLDRGVGADEARRQHPVRLRREGGGEELERAGQELGDHQRRGRRR